MARCAHNGFGSGERRNACVESLPASTTATDPEAERCRGPRADTRGQPATLNCPAGRLSGCRVQQLTHCDAHTLHLCVVPNSDVRIADKEDVAFKRRNAEEVFDSVTSFSPSHAPREIKRATVRLLSRYLRHKACGHLVNNGEQHPRIVVDQRYPEVVHRADPRFPVAGLR